MYTCGWGVIPCSTYSDMQKQHVRTLYTPSLFTTLLAWLLYLKVNSACKKILNMTTQGLNKSFAFNIVFKYLMIWQRKKQVYSANGILNIRQYTLQFRSVVSEVWSFVGNPVNEWKIEERFELAGYSKNKKCWVRMQGCQVANWEPELFKHIYLRQIIPVTF